MMKVLFFGTGGSCAAGSSKRRRYGANTSCIAVLVGKQAVVLDVGTGAVGMAKELASRPLEQIDILLSHYHYDHVDGFPFISPMLGQGRAVTLYGQQRAGVSPEEMMQQLMHPPYFPVTADIYQQRLSYQTIPSGASFSLGEISVKTLELCHPGGATAFRLDWGEKSVVSLLDNEYDKKQDAVLAAFCKGASLLLWDACFLEEELLQRDYKGWGHSTPKQGVQLALLCKAERIALTHHATWRTDEDLDAIQQAARKLHHGAFVALDEMEITL